MARREDVVNDPQTIIPAGQTPEHPAASRIGGWWTAMRFLFPLSLRPIERRAESQSDTSTPVRDFSMWIVPMGLVVGLLWVGAFRTTWRIYGEVSSLRLIPCMTVIVVEALLTGPFLVMGLARTVHVLTGDHPLAPQVDRMEPLSPVGTLVLSLTLLSQFALLLSIQDNNPWWPPPHDWRSWFNPLYPRPIYRPLVLAPLWGRWGIMLAATIGRTARGADGHTRSLNEHLSPGSLLLHSLLPVVLTAIYCSRSRNFLTGINISLLVFAVTYVVSVAIARRGGGQTRASLFAAGQVAQLAFLAIYRAFGRVLEG